MGLGAVSVAAQYVVTHPQLSHNPINFDFLLDPLPFAIGGDILILASLLILGGDFWDKIRSLFIHDSEVHFSQQSSGNQ